MLRCESGEIVFSKVALYSGNHTPKFHQNGPGFVDDFNRAQFGVF